MEWLTAPEVQTALPDLGAWTKPLKIIRDYSLILGITNIARLFEPADIQSLASSLMSAISICVVLSWPSKTLWFRSCHTFQQTRIVKERAPFTFADASDNKGPDNPLYQSRVVTCCGQLSGWNISHELQLQTSVQISRENWHSTSMWCVVSRFLRQS
jgi:hypothetical protein